MYRNLAKQGCWCDTLIFEITFNLNTNKSVKKSENHCYAIALHFVNYNFVKQHKTLRIIPAMAAG
jgi:hypothetical protein